jgi:hypothetical protein
MRPTWTVIREPDLDASLCSRCQSAQVKFARRQGKLRRGQSRIQCAEQIIQGSIWGIGVFPKGLAGTVGGCSVAKSHAQPRIQSAIGEQLPGVFPVAQRQIQRSGEGGGHIAIGKDKWLHRLGQPGAKALQFAAQLLGTGPRGDLGG